MSQLHLTNNKVVSLVQFPPGDPVAGTLAANGTAQALGNQGCQSVLVLVDPDATVNVLIGDASNQTLILSPGMSVLFPVTNVNKLYAKVASGSGPVNVGWLAQVVT